MLFGHNSNVQVGDATFHVQTEDRGVATALIDTTVYFGGRVMHRRTNNYHDLIPLNPDREEALRLRLDEQHRTTLEDIRSGALYLAAPPPPNPETRSAALQGRIVPTETNGTAPPSELPRGTAAATAAPLKLNLRNAHTWLSGKQARLEITVSNASGEPQSGATVTVHIEGAATQEIYRSETNAEGSAEITFNLPRLAGGEAALVIEARQNHADMPNVPNDAQSNAAGPARLRFALRTKPRPS